MLVPEEDIAALEAEVAELLSILEILPAADHDGSDDETIILSIRRYVEQVEHISSTAHRIGLLGLRDVGLLFQENLTNWDVRQQGLSDVLRERLEEWPILVIGYLGALTDVQASEPLIDHLRDSVWNTPLSAEEGQALCDMLICGVLAVDDEDSVAEKPTALLNEASAEEIEEGVPSQPESMNEPESVLLPSPIIAIEQLPTANPDKSVAIEAAETLSEPETVTEAETLSEPETVTEAAEILSEPEITIKVAAEKLDLVNETAIPEETVPDHGESVVEESILAETGESELSNSESTTEQITEQPSCIQEEIAVSGWVPDEEDEPEAEAEAAREESIADDSASFEDEKREIVAEEDEEITGNEELSSDEAEEWDATAEDDDDEPAAMAGSGIAGQELLEILCAEVAQIAEAADEILKLATDVNSAPAARNEALLGYVEHLDRFGEAAASIGLTGLQQVCVGFQNNLKQLAAQEYPLTAEQQQLVESWPDLTLNYLQALNDPVACAALANHCRDARWPQPLTAADVDSLMRHLIAAKLATMESEVETRLQQAQPADVSLALPADVNADLLDSLLQELPNQAAEFSAAIQRLVTGSGTLKDVDVARRIAHTLKGAGNTVGVRGIAVLTHQIEDILQALANHEALPNRPLAETLLNAADCLETMSEALLGLSTPPPQAQAVLQEVLDWANRIDRLGIPTDEASSPKIAASPAPIRSEPVVPTDATPSPASAAVAPATPEAALRIPAHLVDDLLRLVGENIILTSQIQEQVRKTIAHARSVIGQNRLFQQLTGELEQLVDIRNVSSPLSRSIQRGDFDPLELEQYNELNTVTHRLLEAATDNREMGRAITDSLAALDTLLVDQGRLHRESQEAVLRVRMVPIQTVTPRLQRSVRQTCRLADKEVEMTVRGAETLIDSNVLNGIVDPLMHILRNAVDHGIESPDQRRCFGKPPAGQIILSILREGNAIVIRCQDDGAGLDLEAIRQTALERGLLTTDQVLDDDELVRLILLPGFSTRNEATQTSGRGIGMDMVYSRLLELKGSLRIQTRTGQGCLMELRLPVTLISTHALLVRVQDRLYALSDRGIEQILHSGAGVIQKLGKITTYHMGDDVYELSMLETLLNFPPDRREKARVTPPVLLVREETGAIRAVMVSEAIDSRDLVVKPLGQYVPKINGVVGATILGDGSVAPVLDLPEMLRIPATVLQPTLRTAQPMATATPTAKRQVALAVDDSLSARRSLAQFAQEVGLEVQMARDGLEAVELINRKRPDIVLADLEMPRMNGLELAAHLRANQVTRDLPVIMITSRSTDKHRREAEAMGVNAYLTKPFVEDELLGHIKKLLRRP